MADRTQPRRRGYRRNYQACEACKKQKGRCDLGSPDNPQPPCTRCRRARKECVFGPSRFTSRGHASDSTSPAAQTTGSSTAAPSGILNLSGVRETADRTWTSERVSPAGGPSSAINNAAVTPVSQPFSSIGTADAGTVTSQISTQDEGHLRDHLMNATIRNPTEAMTLLSHTMRHTREQPADPPFPATHSESRYPPDDIYCRDYELGPTPRSKFRANEYPEAWDDNPRGNEETFSTWMHFRMCKDKLLSPNEALFLINYFFEHMNSLNPILSDYYHDPKNHLEMLREEPTLTCTIICIAARYARLPGHASVSRGMMVHNTLFRHVQTCISRLIWGIGEEEIGLGKLIGFIECLLLFINWHPRALQMLLEFSELAPPTDFETVAHGKYFFETTVRGIHAHVITRLCRQQNRMTWMLIGLAATVAHEIGLFDPGSTPSRITTIEDERKLRVKKHILLNCVEAHFRLGKAATMQQPFGLSFDIQPLNTVIELDERRKYIHSSLDCGLEIAQLAHMATTTLYQSPSQTKNMIVSKKYLGAVSHFDTLFQNWHSKVRSIPSPVPTFTAQADIMYHSIRSYIHLIAVQAIMERSLPTSYQNAKPDQPILYDESNLAEIMNLPETARDLDLIKVIASGCRRIMEIVLELHRIDSFRSTTDQIRQHVVSAILFALKVVGLNVEPKSDMITLIKQVVHVIEISAIDDIDLGPIYAETLRTLIAKVENARPARTNPFPSSTGQASAMQQKDHDEATNGYCPRTGATLSPSNDTTTTPSSSSRAMATSVATSGSTAPTPALQSANDPNVATNAPLGSGEDDGGSRFPDVTTAMDTDLGGNPSDWSQWLAFQFDPSFTAFEMGYMVDTTNPFM